MALKNLFDMVKADRYTADGREELIKAQEAETEDKVYQIGEISQKTGLQKTANGWVKPKNGNQPGAKKQNATAGSKKIDYQVTEKGGKFYATGHQFSDGSQLHAGPFGSEKELHEFMNGSPYKSTAESKPGAKKEEPKNVHGAEVDKIYERQLKRIKELKAKGFTDEQIDNDKIIKQTKEDMKNVGKKPESKPAAQEVKSEYTAEDLPEVGQKITLNWKDKGKTGIKGTVVGFKTINGKTYAVVRGEDKSLSPTGEFNVNLQILKSDGPRLNTNKGKVITGNVEQKNGIWEPIYGEPTDAAPRILTDDTRIRVRKA